MHRLFRCVSCYSTIATTARRKLPNQCPACEYKRFNKRNIWEELEL